MDQEARMQQLSPKELLEIIENSQDYRPEIIAFAEAELESRNLDPQETAQFRTLVLQEQDEAIERKKAEKDNWNWALKVVQDFVAEKSSLILIACVFIAIVITIRLPEIISLISYILKANLSWDWSSTEVVLPIGLLIVGMFGLFFEKTWAWILSVGVLLYLTFKLVILFIWQVQHLGESIWDSFFGREQGITLVGFGLFSSLTIAPLIILYLPAVYKRLNVPKWAFFAVPILMFLLTLSLYSRLF